MSRRRYTPDELDARLKFILGITLGGILFMTAAGILFALIFVEQPLSGQSENDKMFFNVLGSVATFITGTLAGLLIGKSSSGQEIVYDEPVAPVQETKVEEVVEQVSGKPEGEMPEEQPIDEEWDKD